MTAFKMMKEPVRPTRKRIPGERIYIWDCANIADILDTLKKAGIDPSDAIFVVERDYDGSVDSYVEYNFEEPFDEWKKRSDKYEEDLIEYFEWEKKNAGAIRQFKKDKKEKEEKKKIAELQKRRDLIEKEYQRTMKMLDRINKS